MTEPINPIDAAAVRVMQQLAAAVSSMVEESAEDLAALADNVTFSLPRMSGRFKTLEENADVLAEEVAVENPEEIVETFLTPKEIERAAARVQKSNEELQARSLLILHSRISPRDTPDDILRKVREAYPDFSLADEALSFLLEASSPETRRAIREAQTQFRSIYDREIRAGKNIELQARAFSKEGLGSPTSLRDLYRDIILNPREPLQLFEELTNRFPYAKLRPSILFLLHSLGADLKSKGPSIARGELARLLDDTRSLQGILGVYRFFQARMATIRTQLFSMEPNAAFRITFEDLAKGFVRLLGERYMSPEKVFQMARQLGISDQILLQILIFSQMREATKQTSPRYYRNPQHREELRHALIKAIEDLEKQQEEEEEEEE